MFLRHTQRELNIGMLNLRTEKANHAQLNKQLLDLVFEVGDLQRAASAASGALQHSAPNIAGDEQWGTWFFSWLPSLMMTLKRGLVMRARSAGGRVEARAGTCTR